MKVWLKVAVICIVVLVASDMALAGKFRAYYTKIDSGEAFEKYSRTGPYADIVVELGEGKFVFWRGSSYLPYWDCLLYTSPSPRDRTRSRMPSSA